MPRSTTIILAVTLLLLCTVAAPWAAANVVAGQVTLVSGSLNVSGFSAAAGTTLYKGDVLTTGSSPALISLSDGRLITVSVDSQIRLDVSGNKITVVIVSGTAYDSADPDAGLANQTVTELAAASTDNEKGKGKSPKGPPFEPPGPPPNKPPRPKP